MPSIAENILSTVLTDLVKITTGNAYRNTIKSAKKGAISFEQKYNLPACGCALANENLIERARGDTIGIYEADLLIECLFKADTGEGKLTDLGESIIDDIKKHFRQDSSVNQTSLSSLLNIQFIRSVVVSKVFRALDYDENKGQCLFVLKLEYTELI